MITIRLRHRQEMSALLKQIASRRKAPTLAEIFRKEGPISDEITKRRSYPQIDGFRPKADSDSSRKLACAIHRKNLASYRLYGLKSYATWMSGFEEKEAGETRAPRQAHRTGCSVALSPYRRRSRRNFAANVAADRPIHLAQGVADERSIGLGGCRARGWRGSRSKRHLP